MSLVGYFLKVKNRFNYLHTTSTQLNLDSNKSWLIKNVLRLRKKIIYRLNSHLLTNSFGTKEDAVKYYKINNDKISVFPLLLKNSSITYKNYDERENAICVVGRLHPSKGHKQLFRLFKKCLYKYPKLKLKIIGSGYLLKEATIFSHKFEN